MRNNSFRNKIFYQIPVFLVVLAISIPMVIAPVSSNVLFSPSSIQVNQLAYAEDEGDSSGGGDSDSSGGGDSDSSGGGDSDSSGGGDSDSSGGGDSDSSGGGDSHNEDQSISSSTTTDPTLAPSTTTDPTLAPSTTTDPTLAPSTTTDPTLNQSPLGLIFSTEYASPSLSVETEDEDLNCEDVSDRNFKVSSSDPNGFDGDNDGIGCESDSKDNKGGNNDIAPISLTNEGPDNDCKLNPDLPKCASVDGDCPDGFFNNDDDQCVPEGGCPDGYHTVDDDETGRCIPDSEGCPDGMIFRSDGKTCGDEEQLCQGNTGLEGCPEAPETCDPAYPDHCIKPSETDLDCNWDGNVQEDEIADKNFPVGPSDPHGFDGKDKDGIGCEKEDAPNNNFISNLDILNCEDIQGSIKVTSADPNRLDKDKDGIGCENNGRGGNGHNNNNNDDDDGSGNNDDNNDSNNYIIMPSDSCNDISDTIDLSSDMIDPQETRTIAYFGNCELDSASLRLNLVQNSDLKLVAANLEDGLSDAVEVDLHQIEQSGSDSHILYEATITDNQEGQDLDTDETKTLNNVNGIVLWNDDEDESIEFADNNFVEANINFFN
jgi:hypothetical protein